MKKLWLCCVLVACGNSATTPTDATTSVDTFPGDAMADAPMRAVPATTFDCVHGWFFEIDDAGTIDVTPYSSLGVCMKWPRYLDGTTMLPLLPCSDLPSDPNSADDKAYNQGCRPLSVHPAALQRQSPSMAHYFRPAFPMVLAEKPSSNASSTLGGEPLRNSETPRNFLGGCDPLAQTGCVGTDKCTWIIDSNSANGIVGRVGCTAGGTVAAGQACVIGAGGAMPTGADNCLKGLACSSGVCKAVCNTTAGGLPNCGTAAACATYGGLFGNEGESAVAGVCDPNCNPLTQKIQDGAAACGSPDPANPTKGCYGFWADKKGSRFTCSSAGNLLAKQDFVLAARIFINSCAPGFFSGLSRGTGTMQSICSAHCNPGDVYQGRSEGKGGVLLPGNTSALATCGDRGAI